MSKKERNYLRGREIAGDRARKEECLREIEIEEEYEKEIE
jgi:hypothetical protein